MEKIIIEIIKEQPMEKEVLLKTLDEIIEKALISLENKYKRKITK